MPVAVTATDAAFINDQLPMPLYHQVYLVLRNKILTGVYPVDAILPGEQQMNQSFGVSRITTKRALNELASEGLVVRERGRGTRVIYRSSLPPVQANVEGLLENLLAMGLETEVELLDFSYVQPNAEIAAILRCTNNQDVQRAVRIRRLENEPFSYLTTYVPGDIGRSYSRKDLASKPLLSLLERSGIVIGRADQTLSATLADSEVSAALKLDLGSPLLCIQRTVYDSAERPVESITALYRPDRYQYHMQLSRVGDEHTRSWSMAG